MARKDIQDIREDMALFDQLPEAYRRFLTEYPRGLFSADAFSVLEMKGGNVAAAIEYIRRRLPVPPDQEAPMVPRRRLRDRAFPLRPIVSR